MRRIWGLCVALAAIVLAAACTAGSSPVAGVAGDESAQELVSPVATAEQPTVSTTLGELVSASGQQAPTGGGAGQETTRPTLEQGYGYTSRSIAGARVNPELCLTGLDHLDEVHRQTGDELLGFIDDQNLVDTSTGVVRPYMPGMRDVDYRRDHKGDHSYGGHKYKGGGHGDGEPVYDGPMYRPHLVIGPPDLELPSRLTDLVQLLRVDLEKVSPPELGGDVLTERSDRSDGMSWDVGPLEFSDIEPLPPQAETDSSEGSETSVVPPPPPPPDVDLNGLVSLWVIASAEHPALLDPAVISQLFPESGLEPVFMLVPNGGHMYGPEGAARPGLELSRFAPHPFSGQVAVLDTSFDSVPLLGDEESVLGHGSFIAGIVKEMLPEASVATVDLGPAGRNVVEAIEDGLREVNVRVAPVEGEMRNFDVDTFSLLVTLSFLRRYEVRIDAINMSFGAYNCDGWNSLGRTPPVGLKNAIGELSKATKIFAAAGNDGVDTPLWPAALGPDDPRLFSVGAVDDHGQMADFSNHGTWVEQCDVGVDVNARPFLADGTWSSERFLWDGTSFASPTAMARHLANQERASGGPDDNNSVMLEELAECGAAVEMSSPETP